MQLLSLGQACVCRCWTYTVIQGSPLSIFPWQTQRPAPARTGQSCARSLWSSKHHPRQSPAKAQSGNPDTEQLAVRAGLAAQPRPCTPSPLRRAGNLPQQQGPGGDGERRGQTRRPTVPDCCVRGARHPPRDSHQRGRRQPSSANAPRPSLAVQNLSSH